MCSLASSIYTHPTAHTITRALRTHAPAARSLARSQSLALHTHTQSTRARETMQGAHENDFTLLPRIAFKAQPCVGVVICVGVVGSDSVFSKTPFFLYQCVGEHQRYTA